MDPNVSTPELSFAAPFPHFYPWLGLVLGLALIQVALLVFVWRGRRRGNPPNDPWITWVAAAVPVVQLALTVLAIHAARAPMLTLKTPAELAPGEWARIVNEAIEGSLVGSAFALTIALASPIVSIMVVALSQADQSRNTETTGSENGLTASQDRRFSAWIIALCAFPCLGLWPVILDAQASLREYFTTFDRLKELAPVEKGTVLWSILRAGGRVGDHYAWLSVPGACMAGVLVFFAWIKLLAPRTGVDRLTWPRTIALVAPCLAVGAASFVFAKPYRVEHAQPWPDCLDHHQHAPIATVSPVPTLDGPDPVIRAPYVQISDGTLTLDDRPANLADLSEELRTYRHNHNLLQSYERSPARLQIVCATDTPMATITPVLAASAKADVRHLDFVFPRKEILRRPRWGVLASWHASAATARIFDPDFDEAPTGEVMDPTTFATCGEFTRRLIDLRRQGADVTLQWKTLAKAP